MLDLQRLRFVRRFVAPVLPPSSYCAVLACAGWLGAQSVCLAQDPVPEARRPRMAPAPAAAPETPAPAAAPETPAQAPWPGFRLELPGRDAELRVGGLVQADWLTLFTSGGVARTGFEVRRGRLALGGKLGRRFGFRVETQYVPGGMQLLDAYVDVRLAPEVALRMGKMKTPLGLEMLQPIGTLLLPERGLTTALVPIRDVGAQLGGEWDDGVVAYALGMFGGAPDGESPLASVDAHVDVYARLFVQPWLASSLAPLQKLGVGVAGGWGNEEGVPTDPGLGRYQTGAREVFFAYADGAVADGQRWRVNPQLWWYWGPLGVLGEYVYAAQRIRSGSGARMQGNQAWLAGASYVLTGEDAAYTAVLPRRAWGALALAARYSELRFDDDAFALGAVTGAAPRVVRAWGVGLSYWASAVIRAQLAFEQTRFGRAPESGPEPENALVFRLQATP